MPISGRLDFHTRHFWHCLSGRLEPGGALDSDDVEGGEGFGSGSTVLFAGGEVAGDGGEVIESFGTEVFGAEVGEMPEGFEVEGDEAAAGGPEAVGAMSLASNLSKVVDWKGNAENGGGLISKTTAGLLTFDIVRLESSPVAEPLAAAGAFVSIVAALAFDSCCPNSRRT